MVFKKNLRICYILCKIPASLMYFCYSWHMTTFCLMKSIKKFNRNDFCLACNNMRFSLCQCRIVIHIFLQQLGITHPLKCFTLAPVFNGDCRFYFLILNERRLVRRYFKCMFTVKTHLTEWKDRFWRKQYYSRLQSDQKCSIEKERGRKANVLSYLNLK